MFWGENLADKQKSTIFADMKKKRETAMLFVQNLSVHGGQPVPADERGVDALIDEKYDKWNLSHHNDIRKSAWLPFSCPYPLLPLHKACEITFCKASAGIMPTSWFSSFFENAQLLLDTNREEENGDGHIRSSLEQNLTNIHLLPVFYKAITDKQVLQFSYQRFGQEPFLLTFHPQYLKEYNGRWFVFGDADREPYKAYNVPQKANAAIFWK